MRAILFLALRELKNHWRFTLFFTTNLAAGLVGLTAVLGLQHSLAESLGARSRTMLAADLGISARRDLTAAERLQVNLTVQAATGPAPAEAASFTKVIDLFSMVQSPESKRSRLAQLRGVEASYPFYGDLELVRRGHLGAGAAAALPAGATWVDQGLARELGLAIGGTVSAGGIPLVIDDLIVKDSTNGFVSFTLGPRLYLHASQLENSSLLDHGATATRGLLVRLPEAQRDSALDALEARLNLALPDPGVRVRTHRRASEEASRLFSYLNDTLGLVSLSALLLASLGATFQFRRFFLSRAPSVAVLLALGASRRRALALLAIQLLVTGLLAALLAAAAGALLLPALAPWFTGIVPEGSIRWSLNLPAAATGLGIGITASLLLCLPQLSALGRLSAAALFREDFRESLRVQRTALLNYLPAAAAFVALAVHLSKSWRAGLGFVFGLAATAGLLASAGALVLWGLRLLESRQSLAFRLALRHLVRARATTWLTCLTVGLAAMLTSLIPQLRSNLATELRGASAPGRPSLFLFDIQEEQLVPLRETLVRLGAPLQTSLPFIRARLLAVNGQGFEKDATTPAGFRTREAELESGQRNRGFNLSYRDPPGPADNLIAGRDFSGRWDAASGKLPELSIEQAFAKRLGWKLGDRLRFEVLGVPVEGEVVNLRRVKWSSFQPNFFVEVQPGVLDDTPKTWLASVPPVSREKKQQLQDALVTDFGNVSMVDIGEVLALVGKLSEQTATALFLMAGLTVFAGLLTFLAIARFEAFSRRWDMNLMKVLGSGPGLVSRIFLWEALLVSLVAGGVGTLASLGVSLGLSRLVFDSEWNPDLQIAWATAALAIAVSLGATTVSSWSVWRGRPLDLLAGR